MNVTNFIEPLGFVTYEHDVSRVLQADRDRLLIDAFSRGFTQPYRLWFYEREPYHPIFEPDVDPLSGIALRGRIDEFLALDDPAIGDYKAAQSLLETALKIRAAALDGSARAYKSPEKLNDCLSALGVRADFMPDGSRFTASWAFSLPISNCYGEYLRLGVEYADDVRVSSTIPDLLSATSGKDYEGAMIAVRLGEYERSGKGMRSGLMALYDCLMTIHMHDLRIKSHGLGRLTADDCSYITALWLATNQSANIGRIGVCDVCGTPFIAVSEKRKRRYCGNRCKQRAHRTNAKPPTPPDGRVCLEQ